MQSISFRTAEREKLIRFMTPGPFMASEDAFFMADGGKLRITSGYDGKVSSFVCKYLDPHHFQVGSSIFHMDQFSEFMGRNDNTFEPEQYLTDLSLFNQVYCDRTLIDEHGKLIPYHEVVFQLDPSDRGKQLLRIALCPDADALRKACIMSREGSHVDQTFVSLEHLYERLQGDLYGKLHRWDHNALVAVLHDLIDKELKIDLDSQIGHAAQQAAAAMAPDSTPTPELLR